MMTFTFAAVLELAAKHGQMVVREKGTTVRPADVVTIDDEGYIYNAGLLCVGRIAH